MQRKSLSANQILTTHDFPVFSEQILKIYFKICQTNPNILPATPVFHKSLGLPLLKNDDDFSKKHNLAIQKYFENNPRVEYILCDGSHKTTALNLTHHSIHAMVIESDEDLKEIRRMVERGDVFSFAAEETVDDVLAGSAKHFSESKNFETVEEKTNRMIEKKVIPQFMIDHHAQN